MPEQRSGVHARLTVPGEVGMVDEVAGHQIDGPFDTLERTADPAREGLEEGRLANPHVAFEQGVSAGQSGDQQQPDGSSLADHDPVGVRFEPQRPITPCLDPVPRFDLRLDSAGRRPGGRLGHVNAPVW